MDDKQLRHLSRRDLLGLLEELSRENDRLQAELDEANRKLDDRRVALGRCGSMAEAALELSGIFEAADRAAQIYVESLSQAAAQVQPAPRTEGGAVEQPAPPVRDAQPTRSLASETSEEDVRPRPAPRHGRHLCKDRADG